MYTLLYRINSLPVTSLRGTKQSRIYHFSIKYWIATSGIPPRNDGVFWICNAVPCKATQWRDVHNRRCRVAKPTDNAATHISPAWGGIMG